MTKYGASIGGAAGETIASQLVRYPGLKVIRNFGTPIPSGTPAGLVTGMELWQSFKVSSSNFTAMSANTYDAAIIAYLQSLPAWVKLRLTYYHEPEDNWPTPAAFAKAQDHFINLVHTAPGVVAQVEAWVIFTAYIITYGHPGGSARNIEDWWPTKYVPDGVGADFDGVVVASTYPTNFATWAGYWKTFAASKGIKWAVTEYGNQAIASDTTHSGRAAWLTARAGELAAAGADPIILWDDNSTGNADHLTTTNEISAWATLVAGSTTTTVAAPTGLAVTPATDGLSATIVWATLPGTVNHLDSYLQKITEGETSLHKYNGTALAPSPRAATFATVPGESYNASLVAVDGSGNRSPYGAIINFQAPKPGGNHDPVIVTASATVDAADPLLYHYAATATDADGNPLTYTWVTTNPKTGVGVTDIGPTVDHLFAASGAQDLVLTVSDGAGGATPWTAHLSVNADGVYTVGPFPLRMLQPSEDVRNMGPIERQSKPIVAAALMAARARRSPHNAKHHLVASTFPPSDLALGGGLSLAPALSDFWYCTLVAEGDVLAHLTAISTRKQLGSGALGGIFDETGLLLDPGSFSIDTMMQQNPGEIYQDTPANLPSLEPGTPFIFGMWWPPTGVTQTPALQVRGGASPASGIGVVNPVTGLIPARSTFPTTIPFGSVTACGEPFIGVPEN